MYLDFKLKMYILHRCVNFMEALQATRVCKSVYVKYDDDSVTFSLFHKKGNYRNDNSKKFKTTERPTE